MATAKKIKYEEFIILAETRDMTELHYCNRCNVEIC